jgi:hypothetical protein
MSGLAELISALVAIVALAGSFYAWRTRELRREEVLKWGLDCIEVLRTSVLYFEAVNQRSESVDLLEGRRLRVRSSILCDHGRLFFKNQISGSFDQNKRPAYRGHRPIILDRLVVNCQLLESLERPNQPDLSSVARVAKDNLKHFVSLIQDEVGRAQTASPDASLGGESINIERLLADDKKARS